LHEDVLRFAGLLLIFFLEFKTSAYGAYSFINRLFTFRITTPCFFILMMARV
jgi:hypothetical protein